MKYLVRYILNVLSVVSISINVVIFLGAPNEALSERCGRHEYHDTNIFFGYFLRHIIDGLLFWDKNGTYGHCYKSFILETTGEVLR